MFETAFHRILGLSLVGSYCILLALPIRLLLLKCGRKYAYYLWFAVFLNLAVPFTLHGRYSLIPPQVAKMSAVEKSGGSQAENRFLGAGNVYRLERETVRPGQGVIQDATPGPDPTAGAGSRTFEMRRVLCVVWLIGLFGIGWFSARRMVKVKQETLGKYWTYWDKERRIAEIPGLPAPFLWGVFRPIIYLPSGLGDEERAYIVAHESCHRRRQDSAVKIVVFMAAAIHWFNPLVWLAWALFCVDMEISCDEAVLSCAGKDTGRDIKKQYAQSLLKYAAAQNGYLMAPLTFGEPSVKTRIKNVLHFRRRNIVTGITAGIMVAAVTLGLAVRPVLAGALELPYMPVLYPEAGSLYEPETRQDDFSDVEVRLIEFDLNNYAYFTPGLRSEDELDTLARKALKELYDMTGYKPESCVYSCTDLGSFFFAKTEEDLSHSLTFYDRSFGERDGYDPLVIESMNIVYAGQVWFGSVQWYSPVQWSVMPENAAELTDEELAMWYLQRSGVYRGEELTYVKTVPEENVIRVFAADGSSYDVSLWDEARAINTVYGPYPAGFSH